MNAALSATPAVVFVTPDERLVADTPLRRERVPAAALPARLAACWQDDRSHSAVAFAAVPFSPRHDTWLMLGQRSTRDPFERPTDSPGTTSQPRTAVSSLPTRDGYAAAVAAALARIAATPRPELHKVVLSRRLTVTHDSAIDLSALLDRLRRDPHATTFCFPLESDAPNRVLVGATPELLVAKHGTAVTSSPLAGSARRAGDAAADRHTATRLTHSPKDLREHAVVVEWIADRLTPFCRSLSMPTGPSLVSTASMWHLGTTIRGELRHADTPSAELALALHPTPAVCGAPLDFALDTIGALEPFDRRFYGGVVGWTDRTGDGRWMVSIRCAEVDGATAHLFAGAGIVDGSDPGAEADETSAKLTTLLSALGIDEQGHALPGGGR